MSLRKKPDFSRAAAGEERAHPSGATRERVDACLATSVYSDEEPCRCAI